MNPQNKSHDSPSAVDSPPSRPTDGQDFYAASVLNIAAAHGVHDTYQSFLPPLLPALIALYSLSKAQAGLLALILDLPSLLQPLIGHWADRVDLRILVFLGPAITIVMMSLLGIAPSYGVLALLLMVAGVSRAGFHAVAPVVAGRLSGRRLGRGMGFWMVGGRLGPTLGPVLVVAAVELLGLRGLTTLMLPGLLVMFILYFRQRGADTWLRPAHPQPISMHALGEMAPLMLMVGGIITIRSFLTSGLSIYLPTYLTEEGAELWFAGMAFSVFQGAGTLGVLFAGALSDRVGRRALLLVAFLAGPIFTLVSLRADGYRQVLMLFFVGLTSMSTMPVFMALVQESFPKSRSLANGVFLALAFLIQSLVGVVIGAAGDLFGLRRVLTAGALICWLGVPLILRLPTTVGHRSSEQ